MKIIIKKKFSYIYLNKKIYNINNIKKSISDFHEFLEVSIKEFEKYTVLKLVSKTKEFEIGQLSFEFLNYLNGGEFNEL